MNERIKWLAKIILKKEYRDSVWEDMREGTFETISSAQIDCAPRIMILRRHNPNVGMFSDYITFLNAIEFSVQRNYIPIIDRKTVKNIFLPAKESVNTWEYFFEQPMGLRLQDIDTKSMDVKVYHLMNIPVSIMHCNNQKTIEYWRETARTYLRFQPEFLTELQNMKVKLIEGKRVLGVSVREGYIKLAAQWPELIGGHPVQLGIADMVQLTERYMQEWKCEYVFFACQTNDTQKLFEKIFGDRAICLNRKRPSYEELQEGPEIKREQEDAVRIEKEYITEMYLLSQCTSFLCSENSGSEAAFIMSKGFENFKCVDLTEYVGRV